MKWYILALKKYAIFTGRSRRKEYWMFVLFSLIFGIVARVLDNLLGLSWSGRANGGLINTLFQLAMLVPSLAVTARRFHDIGKSAWNYLWFAGIGLIATVIYIIKIIGLAIASGLSADEVDASVIMQFMTPTLIWLLVVLVTGIVFIILMAKDSQPGANKWGPNPKEPEAQPTDFTALQ